MDTIRYTAAPKVVFRRLAEGEGAVLLRLETGAYHGLNELGARIWELVESGGTPADVVQVLEREVEGAPEALSDDVEAFVNDLVARDLLVAA